MTVSIYCNTGFFIEQCSVKQRYGGKVKKDDLSWFTSKSDRMHIAHAQSTVYSTALM